VPSVEDCLATVAQTCTSVMPSIEDCLATVLYNQTGKIELRTDLHPLFNPCIVQAQ